MDQKMIVYVSGSSGVGKNTMIAKLVEKEKNIKFIVSYTTREKRPFEKNGVQYHFVTKEEFENLHAEHKIIEYDVIHHNYMGHALTTIDEDFDKYDVVIKDLTIAGVEKAKVVIGEKYPILTIFLTESKKVLKERLIGRGEKDVKLRLKVYHKEQKQAKNYNYIVRNQDMDRTVEVVKSIIQNERKQKILYTTESCQSISHAKVEKLENKLLKGKNIGSIEVTEKEGKLYIIKGRRLYLASQKCGVPVGKVVNNNAEVSILPKNEIEEWTKIVKNYKKEK